MSGSLARLAARAAWPPAEARVAPTVPAPTVEPETVPGTRAITGFELRVIDAGCHDLDALRVGVVERRELRALVVGRRKDEIGAGDDLLLDARPEFRVVVDTGVGLDARERVERRDQRQIERVLQAVSDGSRQPVVRVQDVDRWLLEQHRLGGVDEGIDEIDQRVLRDRSARPRRNVEDAESGLHLHDVGLLRMFGARVHVAVDAGLCQRGRERAHVHVHPATVARARLGQRRRVHAEHGDAAVGRRVG